MESSLDFWIGQRYSISATNETFRLIRTRKKEDDDKIKSYDKIEQERRKKRKEKLIMKIV
jgi:hypothetical protein